MGAAARFDRSLRPERYRAEPQTIGMVNFMTPSGPATVALGFAQAKGLAARAKWMRARGISDDAICDALRLCKGQIANLLRQVTRATNLAEERAANQGRTLPRGLKAGASPERASGARGKRDCAPAGVLCEAQEISRRT